MTNKFVEPILNQKPITSHFKLYNGLTGLIEDVMAFFMATCLKKDTKEMS